MQYQNKRLFKSISVIWVLVYSICLVSCINQNTKKAIDHVLPEYLKNSDPNYVALQDLFIEFPILYKNMKLLHGEKKVVGMWFYSPFYNYKDNRYSVTLFPNKLAFIWIVQEVNDASGEFLWKLYGTWDISGDMIIISLYGYDINRLNEAHDKHIFISFEEITNFPFLNLKYILKEYTIKESEDFIFPTELLDRYSNLPKQFEGSIFSRHLKRISVTDGAFYYKEFVFINEMTKLSITGEMIVTDPEKYRKYLEF